MFNFLMGKFPQTDANIFQKVDDCMRLDPNWSVLSLMPDTDERKQQLKAVKTCLDSDGTRLTDKLRKTCKLRSHTMW